jgi:uncharacterized protein YqgV (UPF0045/DUF77 family)
MLISAQISIYPLRQQCLTPVIQGVSQALARAGLHPEVGPMSTLVTGEAKGVFAALYEGFAAAAAAGHVVMTATFSNACPIGE